MSDLKRLDEQFLKDPMFATLVRTLEHLIYSMELTPFEVRQAAMYAAMRVEQTRVKPLIYDDSFFRKGEP